MFARICIVLIIVAFAVGTIARSSSGAGHERVYVVRAADTLWSIAVRHYAGDPREAVWRLERRNRLDGTLIRPGLRLVLP
jgi:nucleoid-associated protein YgaU